MQLLLPKPLEDYCTQYSQREDETLGNIARHTYNNTVKPRLYSAEWQASLLTLLSQMHSPRYIVEIGTFTGYSAVALARGLQAGGWLITIENDQEMAAKTRDLLATLGQDASNVELLCGDALSIIPKLDDGIDFVFIDAKKTEYQDYYEAVLPKVKSGGVILVDNVLWYGKIWSQTEMDATTQSIHNFNVHVANDDRVTNCLVPLRDGLNLIRKV